ncbi:hypothetical protein RHSIM_Rhsim07G0234300 [Rhododendron simsii]|uniref:Uncharacterized protein n=1 Tax=Rhododendron simsii TaxID=118357 RepID=A0A834GY40_RHOSS|nr:hypothetical protein RHSIM_Rhsim07G0234300 [Rhododendron simsii]
MMFSPRLEEREHELFQFGVDGFGRVKASEESVAPGEFCRGHARPGEDVPLFDLHEVEQGGEALAVQPPGISLIGFGGSVAEAEIRRTMWRRVDGFGGDFGDGKCGQGERKRREVEAIVITLSASPGHFKEPICCRFTVAVRGCPTRLVAAMDLRFPFPLPFPSAFSILDPAGRFPLYAPHVVPRFSAVSPLLDLWSGLFSWGSNLRLMARISCGWAAWVVWLPPWLLLSAADFA